MRILHIEDSREDAELVRNLLVREWPDCSIRVVTNRDAFTESLNSPDYDVILSDFTLGSFTGLDALAIVRERLPDTPFIFLSGTIGEDRAIEALQAGAQDYVLKDGMKRLVSAIRRARRESDESKRRHAAEQASARFAMLLESTPDFVGMAALDGRIFYINRAGLEMLGLPKERDPGLLQLSDLHPKETFETIRSEGIPAATRDGNWVGMTTLLGHDGKLIPVTQIILAHKPTQGNSGYLSIIMHDMSGLEAAERRIREQADLLNRARDAIIVTDLAGKVTFWNQGAERLSGLASDAVIGQSLGDIFGPLSHAEIGMAEKALEGADEWRGEFRLNVNQAKLIVLEVSATLIRDDARRPTSRLYIGTDVTAKKSLEEQFLRAQRLDSIGMLASGIAHDLNNVLAPIFLAAPMLREHVTNPVDLSMIATLERSAERGAGLVRQILSFAHGVGGASEPLNVGVLVRDTASVIRQTFPKNIRLEVKVAANLWSVLGNTTQIHQVLLNLCVNARDAMPGGGKLTLRAENCLLDDIASKAIKGATSGTWVVLHVEDSGTGIPPEVIERMWEPFYTTKGVGKGTGLGLSTVRGIVENHKGFIDLKSNPEWGTAFRVYLPAVSAAQQEGGASSRNAHLPRGNGELILIVDDEAQIRDITAAILSRHGYRVIIARDGTEAVALFAPRSAEISMLISDLNMPNLDGAALANVARRLNPNIKVLAMSGLASGGINTEMRPIAGAFLIKPFKADALLNTVNSLLRGAPADGGGHA
jgi:two-component system cell cycle sensor histidine kinase/response regulator CckA